MVKGRLELSAEGYLERAALDSEGRSDALRYALEQVVLGAPAVAGTALIRPRADDYGPWHVEYAGPSTAEMLHWISARLDDSFEVMARALRQRPPYLQRPPHLFDTSPLLRPLHPSVPMPGALWIVWSDPKEQPSSPLEEFEKGLETLLEVEYKERLNFHRADEPLGPELRKAVTNGDGQALPTLLNTVRMAADADFSFWGDAANGAIEFEWIVGAIGTGFHPELPVGQGVGGRSFARQETIHINDYLNCAYRYPSVRAEIDEQGTRTLLSVPLRGHLPDTGAVLYGARRRVSRFTPAQRILLSRLARSVEPLVGERPVSQFYFPSDDAYLSEKRSELRRILSRSSKVQDLESWLEKFARGPAILTDAEERPYVPGSGERFELLQRSSASDEAPPRAVALTSIGKSERGQLRIWPKAPLPPAGWPDFLDDVAAACNVVLDRAEHANDRLSRLHTRWLEEVMRTITPQTCREGRRLGLPVDRGEVWALAWTGGGAAESANRTRMKLAVQDIALDKLGSPLILTDGEAGVFLLGEPARGEPSAVRDALLEALEPAALWLIHGAVYDSFEGLHGSLLQAVTTARGLRRDNDGQYVSDVGGLGLRSFLGKPELSGSLESFATGLLEPLLAYDSKTGSQLTETLALVLTVGSHAEVAKRLHVHPKTVGYRTRRAEELLGKDLGSPTDRTALGMAAFVWANKQQNQ